MNSDTDATPPTAAVEPPRKPTKDKEECFRELTHHEQVILEFDVEEENRKAASMRAEYLSNVLAIRGSKLLKKTSSENFFRALSEKYTPSVPLEYSSAVVEVERLLSLVPGQSDSGEARKILVAALKIGVNDESLQYRILSQLALVCLNQEDMPSTLWCCNQVLAVAPEDGDADLDTLRYYGALATYFQGSYQDALCILDKCTLPFTELREEIADAVGESGATISLALKTLIEAMLNRDFTVLRKHIRDNYATHALALEDMAVAAVCLLKKKYWDVNKLQNWIDVGLYDQLNLHPDDTLLAVFFRALGSGWGLEPLAELLSKQSWATQSQWERVALFLQNLLNPAECVLTEHLKEAFIDLMTSRWKFIIVYKLKLATLPRLSVVKNYRRHRYWKKCLEAFRSGAVMKFSPDFDECTMDIIKLHALATANRLPGILSTLEDMIPVNLLADWRVPLVHYYALLMKHDLLMFLLDYAHVDVNLLDTGDFLDHPATPLDYLLVFRRDNKYFSTGKPLASHPPTGFAQSKRLLRARGARRAASTAEEDVVDKHDDVLFMAPAPVASPSAPAASNRCRFYALGRCKSGTSCPFVHEGR